MAENPYQAPAASVTDYQQAAFAEDLLAEPNREAAGEAVTWLREAWEGFKAQPLPWVLFFVAFMVLFLVLLALPIVGGLLQMVLLVFVFAMVAVMAEQQRTQSRIDAAAALSELGRQGGPLFIAGLIAVGATLAIGMLVGVAAAVLIGAAGLGAGSEFAIGAGALVFLLVLALMVPLYMAIWFAPTLIALHGVAPVEAFKRSFAACLHNIVPFLLYGVLVFVLAILATLPAGLGWFLLGPVLLLAQYTSYRAIFFAR